MNVFTIRVRRFACHLALLGVLLAAGCGDVSTVANPAPNTLDVDASVGESQGANAPSGATASLTITLTQKGAFNVDHPIQGNDAQTLVCDGNTTLQFSGTSYGGQVPRQANQYTCTYFWDNGAQRAALVIPIVQHAPAHVDRPSSGDTIGVPSAGDSGVTVSYNGPGDAQQVVATASDYNKRTAASDPAPDTGTVTISSAKFDANFDIGWGTITLRRSYPPLDETSLASNARFHSVTLLTPDQVVIVPVHWL
jgi:hypothetical protein